VHLADFPFLEERKRFSKKKKNLKKIKTFSLNRRAVHA
jgi:hypothetical protein